MPEPAVHPASVAERRLVSVLFADLVGFTTLSESRDPEEVRELLAQYFDTSRSLVERYGGLVEKFIGDAVMAVWGTPKANEDDAERAVRAALDLAEAVKMGLDVGLDIAFDAQNMPKVQQLLAVIEGLRPGEITPNLRGIEARARARLAARDGEHDLAESMFKSAVAMFRELGMPLWVATTLAEQAEWLRQEGRAADQLGREAAGIFERLDAKPWLRRVTGTTGAMAGRPSEV